MSDQTELASQSRRRRQAAGAAGSVRAWATGGGFVALGIWSTTVGIGRSLTESLGALTAGAVATGAGGAAAMLVFWARGRSPAAMLRLPRPYLLACGGLFAAYELCLFAALGWSADRSTVLAAGLANYLWPALTVAFSVPILGRRARWPVALGCLLAVGGAAAATLGRADFSFSRLAQAGPGVAAPLLLAATAGVMWALYSNLVKRWGSPQAGAVPLFLLASAAAMGLARLGAAETTAWTGRAVGELCVLAVAQSALAYVLWEAGMRRGSHLLLSLASYFLPIASTAVAAAYLRVLPGLGIVLGCALVTGGALVCHRWISDAPRRAT